MSRRCLNTAAFAETNSYESVLLFFGFLPETCTRFGTPAPLCLAALELISDTSSLASADAIRIKMSATVPLPSRLLDTGCRREENRIPGSAVSRRDADSVLDTRLPDNEVCLV